MDYVKLREFLEAVGYSEVPVGMIYTDEKPESAITPKQGRLPTREDEQKGSIDWETVNKDWVCALGVIWRARKKEQPAAFSENMFGCLGGAYFLGYNKPQLETIIHYVSSGVPGHLEGEHYIESPESARVYYEDLDPAPAPKRYCVFKPVTQFDESQAPEFITFFARPEVISGLHQLATYVTNDMEAVMSPWGAGCANIAHWPRRYAEQGKLKACLGGWDPSCRKYLKTDEITFTVPYKMFEMMINRFKESFLTKRAWQAVKKRIAKSEAKWSSQAV